MDPFPALMVLSVESADEDQLRHEVVTLRCLLATESERSTQLSAEVIRLHASLHEACVCLGDVKMERDAFRRQFEDHHRFNRGPLEARLLEANQVLFEQRLQFRSIVDVLASQRDWVREWAIKCQENLRLQERIERREAGTEVVEMKRVLLETRVKYEELVMTSTQRVAVMAVHESKVRSLGLENKRLTDEVAVQKEQIKRLWMRLEKTSVGCDDTVGEKRHRTPVGSE